VDAWLGWTDVVDRAVGGQKDPNDYATHSTDHRADSGWDGPAPGVDAKGPGAWFVHCCAYPGPNAGPYRGTDEGVAQTVFIIQEFHAANVLLLNGLLAGVFLVGDRGVGDIHEGAGVLLRVGLDDLNLLSSVQAGQTRPCWIILGYGDAGESTDTKQEHNRSHECSNLFGEGASLPPLRCFATGFLDNRYGGGGAEAAVAISMVG